MLRNTEGHNEAWAVDFDRTMVTTLPHYHTHHFLNHVMLDLIKINGKNISLYGVTHRSTHNMQLFYEDTIHKKLEYMDSFPHSTGYFYDIENYLTYKVAENITRTTGLPITVSIIDDIKIGKLGAGFLGLKEFEESFFTKQDIVQSQGVSEHKEYDDKNKQLLLLANELDKQNPGQIQIIRFFDDMERIIDAALEQTHENPAWPKNILLSAYHVVMNIENPYDFEEEDNDFEPVIIPKFYKDKTCIAGKPISATFIKTELQQLQKQSPGDTKNDELKAISESKSVFDIDTHLLFTTKQPKRKNSEEPSCFPCNWFKKGSST